MTRKKTLLSLALLFFLTLGSLLPRECRAGGESSIEAWNLWTTSPWVASIARYVGGVYVNVHFLRTWDEAGLEVTSTETPAFQSRILAVAPGDLIGKGLDPGKFSTRYLYTRDPVPTPRMKLLFLDPAALPFIGQRVMIGISLFDPQHYSYFQRRLAEFQTRLESTLDVGRKIIGDIKLLDLTWRSSQLIEAAVGQPVRPPGKTRLLWENGEDLGLLSLTVTEARNKDWLIITDAWTPSVVHNLIPADARTVKLPPPRQDQELFLFLYDQYLSIWNAVRE